MTGSLLKLDSNGDFLGGLSMVVIVDGKETELEDPVGGEKIELELLEPKGPGEVLLFRLEFSSDLFRELAVERSTGLGNEDDMLMYPVFLMY